MKQVLIISLLMLSSLCTFARDWYNPLINGKSYICGRWWNNETLKSYSRMPEKFKSKIPGSVWGLSQHTAGEYIKFNTDSKNITVKYVLTSSSLQMWHMQSTGVSGVDLYLTNNSGEEHWCASTSRTFSDTVVFNYNNLDYQLTAEFRLYLPLYNGIKFLEIGVDDKSNFSFVSEEGQKPIVAYGTSIAQGACASRPGMAWTNILHRRLRMPIVNLGFSGSGKMEDVMFEALSEIPAKIFIIDCMPNMESGSLPDSIKPRISRGIKVLRRNSSAPIILVEHDGYMNENTVRSQKEIVDYINSQLRESYSQLIEKGGKNIFYISKDDIAMNEDSQVDACHATDYGMLLYADAYQKVISKILRRHLN